MPTNESINTDPIAEIRSKMLLLQNEQPNPNVVIGPLLPNDSRNGVGNYFEITRKNADRSVLTSNVYLYPYKPQIPMVFYQQQVPFVSNMPNRELDGKELAFLSQVVTAPEKEILAMEQVINTLRIDPEANTGEIDLLDL